MRTNRIDFKGITKAELHSKITRLLDKYNGEITENNISVNKNGDTYNISGSIKKFLFSFSIDAEIQLFDNYITVNYDTNIPESLQNTGFEKMETEIKEA